MSANEKSVWSLLFASGYLKTVETRDIEAKLMFIIIDIFGICIYYYKYKLYFFTGGNMRRKNPVIMPKTKKKIAQVGDQIKLARLRRKYTAEIIAERAGISRATLWKIEKGDPGVAFGIYAKVLNAIGLGDDILLLAKDDELGRALQDAELLNKGKKKDIDK